MIKRGPCEHCGRPNCPTKLDIETNNQARVAAVIAKALADIACTLSKLERNRLF